MTNPNSDQTKISSHGTYRASITADGAYARNPCRRTYKAAKAAKRRHDAAERFWSTD